MSRKNPYSLSVDLNAEAMSVEVQVKERETDTVTDTQAFKAADVHESLRSAVALYGLSKLLQDRSSDIKTGPDKLAGMQAVMQQLAEGKWQKERKVGSSTVSAEVEALAQFKGLTIPQAQAALRKYDKAARLQILGHDKIQELAAQIREARSNEDVADLGDLI